MGIYRKKYILKNNDVNMYKKLRTSRLFEMFQSVCVLHTEELGAGREKTLDKGILWVVIQQHIDILRMPEYDEEITVETWPGKTMHVLFPRYFQIKDARGEVLVKGSALWTLIDAKTRSLVFADRYQIEIPGDEQEGQAPLPKAIKHIATEEQTSFTVPYSYCDLNGHMNNARYLDLVEDTIPAASKGQTIRSISTQYEREVRFQETICVSWKKTGNTYYISGDHEKHCFSISITYDGPADC
jgi:medium-chain acyl-[acyl-carrier-protein] hydrolase